MQQLDATVTGFEALYVNRRALATTGKTVERPPKNTAALECRGLHCIYDDKTAMEQLEVGIQHPTPSSLPDLRRPAS